MFEKGWLRLESFWAGIGRKVSFGLEQERRAKELGILTDSYPGDISCSMSDRLS